MERVAVPDVVSEAKLQQWIQEYSTLILRTCYVWLQDRQQAEDAVQDTFIKAWKHIGDLKRKNIRNEKAWLMRIAVNTCRDYRRTAWFRHIDTKVELSTLPPRLTQTTEEDHDMMLTICALPDKYREVILMYYYQGLTEQETADVLGLSLSSAHRRLKKAEELLRAELEGGERHEG